MINITLDQLTGRDESHLIAFEGTYLHEAVVDDWVKLRDAASRRGCQLAIASGYRSFARQLKIWNEKVLGLRPLLNAAGAQIDPQSLSPDQLLFAVLKWSALPGASRHHWGTDIDVYDRAAMPANYQLQLSAEEADDCFRVLHTWLDEVIDAEQSYNFYRPFCGDNGIAEERWHLSHRSVSTAYEAALEADMLKEFYRDVFELELRQPIIDNFEAIYKNYIKH